MKTLIGRRVHATLSKPSRVVMTPVFEDILSARAVALNGRLWRADEQWAEFDVDTVYLHPDDGYEPTGECLGLQGYAFSTKIAHRLNDLSSISTLDESYGGWLEGPDEQGYFFIQTGGEAHPRLTEGGEVEIYALGRWHSAVVEYWDDPSHPPEGWVFQLKFAGERALERVAEFDLEQALEVQKAAIHRPDNTYVVNLFMKNNPGMRVQST